MRKKLPSTTRRKLRNVFINIVPLFLLFIITFLLLLAIYFFHKHKKHVMISPLSLHQESSVLPPEDIVQKTSELLQKFNIASKNVSIATGEAILITLKDGQEVIFSEKKQLAEQMASLQLIVNRLTIEGRKFIRIDFRFNSPVVSF